MKVLNIVQRIIKQIWNDKRTLGLLLVAPVFLMTLIYLLLGESDYKPAITTYGIPESTLGQFDSDEITVDGTDNLAAGKKLVREGKTDALLYIDGTQIRILFETSDSVKDGKVLKCVQSAMKSSTNNAQLEKDYVYGDNNNSMFDSMGYIMLAVLSFFIIFILAGISFLRERTNQTMERLMLTPVKRWEVILGYTLGFGLFAVIQSIILLSYVIIVLNMKVAGSVIIMALIMILLALAAVCFGAFFSIFSNNEFQVVQFIPIVVIPQIFFSGLISLDTLPFHLGYLSKIMPVYYACDALKSICIRGKGLSAIWSDIIALFIFILILFVLNTQVLKKYRRI